LNLTLNEKKVLLALERLGRCGPERLAQESGLGLDVCVQAALLLEEKGLVEVETRVVENYRLSPEGEIYAREGFLPERGLLEYLLEAGEMPVTEVKKRFPRAGIALGWLKRKGWAEIEGGILKPLQKTPPPPGEDEKLLQKIHRGEKVEDKTEIIKQLQKRGLILVETSKTRTFAITSGGREVAASGVTLEEEIAQLTPSLIKSRAWERRPLRSYNLDTLKPVHAVKLHPYQRILDEMREIFLEMGFTEIQGDIIQTGFWNFDALFQPQDHPARDMQDTLYIPEEGELPSEYVERVRSVHENGGNTGSTGWGGRWNPELAKRKLLRTHTTALTIKYLADNPVPPVRAFCIDRAYRREAIDPTHTPEFEQLEGVVMEEGVNFRNLLALLREFYHRLGFREVRFRPGYFPYTEPSIEPEVYIEGIGWLELGGAGIFRREVTAPLGIKTPVLAWGLGVSRVAMLKLGLKDLRELYQSDMDWLRRTPLRRKG